MIHLRVALSSCFPCVVTPHFCVFCVLLYLYESVHVQLIRERVICCSYSTYLLMLDSIFSLDLPIDVASILEVASERQLQYRVNSLSLD